MFEVVKGLMMKDGTLDEYICEFEAEHKRDITREEADVFVIDILKECKRRAMDLSCSVAEAYCDIMC